LPVKKIKMQVVNLPIGATEDMVVGSLDIEKALREGIRALQPGILARANRNILYVDEVNLLPDNIVDIILDSAALGWNYVEREGISVAHPSRFILIGTMNPEEGELRPQLLDRFSMSITIEGVKDSNLRAEIIKRNIEFLENPIEFIKKYEKDQEELRNKIIEARKRLTNVEISDGILLLVAKLCLFLQVDGHRPDIIITMVAKTIAALFGRNYVEPEDVKVAAKLVLGHRTRRGGFLEPATPQEIEVAFDRVLKGIKLKSEKRDKSAKRDIKALLSGRGTGIPSSGNIESLELKGRDTRIPISGFGKPDLREEIEGRIPKETDIPIPQRDKEKSKKKSRLGLGKLKDFFREIFSTNRIQEQRQRF
ncbi:MAG: ATP-binding protein, partial [Candidatus Njordarchaeia archaeon]